MEKIQEQYWKIEQEFLEYSDLKDIKINDNWENFVVVPELENLWAEYFKDDMKQYFDWKIIIRKTVWEKLENIAKFLEKNNKNLKLIITYWYRTLEIQTKYFNNRLNKVIEENPEITNKEQLIEIAHRWVAFPEVAGHPTGWAVDVTLYDLEKQEFLDFWTEPWDYSTKKCYLKSTEITDKQKENRIFLQKIMIKESFSPYLWEWWHFSYWDIENTVFDNKTEAIYWAVLVDDVVIETKNKIFKIKE